MVLMRYAFCRPSGRFFSACAGIGGRVLMREPYGERRAIQAGSLAQCTALPEMFHSSMCKAKWDWHYAMVGSFTIRAVKMYF